MTVSPTVAQESAKPEGAAEPALHADDERMFVHALSRWEKRRAETGTVAVGLA